jgi:aminoglycoside phosphotransferase (APT) family kinase protein
VQSLLGFPADTAVLREAVPSAGPWCDWIDDVLRDPVDSLVVHGDLNGDNQIWRDGMLRLVVDYETVGLAEPEYDFGGVVGFGILDAAIDEYERRTARTLSRARMMAWHARGSLDDIRWRTADGVPLPDGRSPAEWLADLDRRRDALLT